MFVKFAVFGSVFVCCVLLLVSSLVYVFMFFFVALSVYLLHVCLFFVFLLSVSCLPACLLVRSFVSFFLSLAV